MTSTLAGRRLSRDRDGRSAAPVRIAHLGLGNFFRAHPAAYTDETPDAAEWGIAAFTGRSPGLVPALAEQDGLYTLLVRGPAGDEARVVSSVSQVADSSVLDRWRAVFALPGLAMVTLTVTEAGYRRDADGALDVADPEVAADLAALLADGPAAEVRTAPGKLVEGFLVRRATGLGPLTVVPCDNVPGNGAMARRVVRELAVRVDPALAAWMDDHVGYVTTMVDRITPRTVDADRAGLLAEQGVDDPACVVTEPFREWVLSGGFLAGRPAWEAAGARFVDDLEPWENRKLRLLNGSHSLLAYAASIRGATTVAEAIADPVVRGWVEEWWDDAERHLPLPPAEIAAYRAALLERYRNPRIRHLLAQIAADGSQKIPIRILPTLRTELARGRVARGATRALAAWVLHLRGLGAPVQDDRADGLRSAVADVPVEDAVATVLASLDLRDDVLRTTVVAQAGELAPVTETVSGPAPSEVVVGVDVGTTAAKVSVFGLGAPWRHTVVREYPLLRPSPGREEQDPAVLAEAMLAALAEAVTACTGSSVVAVALSSAMHGLLGLDAAGRPLTPLVTWADSRAREEAAALRASGEGAVLHRRSGTPVHPMSPLTKLLWFRRHEPELCRRVAHWVGLKDWMVLTLTGVLSTELSSASATGLLDLATGTWSPATLELTGVAPDQLPPVLATTAVLDLGEAAARRTGLPAGTPVVLGAGDGPLGNLGTGALDPGVAGLSIGTSGAVRAVVPRPGVDERGVMFCYALTADAWVVGGAVSNGGSVLRWAGDVFDAAGTPVDGSRGASDDERTLALAASVPAGSDGLVALPFLMAERAPLWDPTLTGGFLGVRADHTRAHFVRACVEGVALQLSTILAELDAVVPVTAVRATGGVFRSPLWRTVVADVLDRPVTVTDGAEGSALGAAALGLVGVGRAVSPRTALDALRPPGGPEEALTVPRPDAAATYRRLREAVPALVRAYEPVAALLARARPPTPP